MRCRRTFPLMLLVASAVLGPSVAAAALSAPSSLVATAVSSSAITLAWQDVNTGLTGFVVERSLRPTMGYKRVATLAPDARTFEDRGLASATTYYYRVRAVRGGTRSRRSNLASATTLPAGPVATATPTARPTPTRSVTPVPTRTATLVATRTGTPAPSRTVTPSATATPAGDTVAPSVPASLSATAASCARIDLAWAASTDTGGSGLRGYRVQRHDGLTLEVLAPATTGADTQVAAATVYSYTVRAFDNAGNLSASSPVASTNTPACPNQAPVANAGPDRTAAVGVAVGLDGSGSYDPDGTISAYRWTFGDGSSGSGVTTTHAYAAPGTYPVTLTVTDGPGAQASDTALVSVTSGGTWSHGFGSPGEDRGQSVAVGADGEIAATGYFSGTVDFGGGPLTSEHFPWLDGNQYKDVYVARYSASGRHLWSRRIGAEADDRGNGIAMTANGDVVVTGAAANYVDFGDGTLTSAGGGNDVFVARYAAADGSHVWSRRVGGSGEESGRAVVVDGAGNVIVVGHFQGTLDFGGGSLTAAGGATDQDLFVAKYSAAGTHLWSRRFGAASAFDYGNAVAVDASGNVIVTGAFYGAVSFGGGTLTSAGGYDLYVAALSSTGAHLWSKRFGGAGDDYAYGVAVDASGNVVVTGAYQGTVNFGGGSLTSAGGSDVFVARYSPAGAHLWSRTSGAAGGDGGQGVTIDGSGNVVVTGSFQGSVDFGGGALTSIGGGDLFVATYAAADGHHLWSRRFGGSGYQYGQGVAAGSAGAVVVTGYYQTSIDFGDGALASAGLNDAFVASLVP